MILQVPVVVRGQTAERHAFEEDTLTQVVNAHGALMGLNAVVKQGQSLVLVHKASQESQEGKVVFLGTKQEGKAQVGIEFTTPRPQFWHIDFPPDNWKPLG